MKTTRMRSPMALVLLSILSCYVVLGFGAAVYPNGVGGYRGGMGYSGHPYAPHAYRGGMVPGGMPYAGYMSPPPRGMPMQGGFDRPPFNGPIGGLPYGSLGYPGVGGGQPFHLCNGGNCGYWGGCHGGHCGEFYDFRPCSTPECFDGSFHGLECIGGYCERVCHGGTCHDFGKQSCSSKSPSESEEKEATKKEN